MWIFRVGCVWARIAWIDVKLDLPRRTPLFYYFLWLCCYPIKQAYNVRVLECCLQQLRYLSLVNCRDFRNLSVNSTRNCWTTDNDRNLSSVYFGLDSLEVAALSYDSTDAFSPSVSCVFNSSLLERRMLCVYSWNLWDRVGFWGTGGFCQPWWWFQDIGRLSGRTTKALSWHLEEVYGCTFMRRLSLNSFLSDYQTLLTCLRITNKLTFDAVFFAEKKRFTKVRVS